MSKGTMVMAALLAAACGKDARPAPAPVTAGNGPGPTTCADLAAVIEAAQHDFPGYRREDRPVTVEGVAGFESSHAVAGATACRVLTSEPPYPHFYDCDLAPAQPLADARAVIDRWAAAVAACPALADWRADDPTELGRSWRRETGDNHELAVQLFLAGDADQPRPSLIVRMNEI